MEARIIELMNILQGLENDDYKTCQMKNMKVEKIHRQVIGTDIEYICSYLYHYLDDADIRAKDMDYKNFQDSELKKLVVLLEKRDFENAKKISFLEETPDI